MSDETASIIDKEVRKFVEEGEATARKIVSESIDELHNLANALLEYETLTGDEIPVALRGDPVIRADDEQSVADNVRSSVPNTGGVGPAPEPQNS